MDRRAAQRLAQVAYTDDAIAGALLANTHAPSTELRAASDLRQRLLARGDL